MHRSDKANHNPADQHDVGTSSRHGIARVLSRMGVCSRAEAARRVAQGRIQVNGKVVRDPEMPADATRDQIAVDGGVVRSAQRVCIALNKPRGIVVTAADERGRDTVYSLLQDAALPWLAPVGRLDKASEGLLLMSNDPAWAAQITDPVRHVAKIYRVQVRGVPGSDELHRLEAGVSDRGELLHACSAHIIGGGTKNSWVEVVLEEGRNRELRRMFEVLAHPVVRLIRVAIGPLALGDLPKGTWRLLESAEVDALTR